MGTTLMIIGIVLGCIIILALGIYFGRKLKICDRNRRNQEV